MGLKSRDLGLTFGLILFGRLGLEQISLGQSRDEISGTPDSQALGPLGTLVPWERLVFLETCLPRNLES